MKKAIAICLSLPLMFGASPVMTEELVAAETSIEASAGLSKRSLRKMARKAPVNTRALKSVCASTVPLTGALMKNAYPGHIQLSDSRASGFAFVCGRDCAKKFPIPAYYSDGTPAFKLGYYGRWSFNGKPRAYCGAGGAPICNVKTVASNARKAGRDGKVYLDFGNKSCRSATPGVRNGSPT